jgi:hypothetical protein
MYEEEGYCHNIIIQLYYYDYNHHHICSYGIIATLITDKRSILLVHATSEEDVGRKELNLFFMDKIEKRSSFRKCG